MHLSLSFLSLKWKQSNINFVQVYFIGAQNPKVCRFIAHQDFYLARETKKNISLFLALILQKSLHSVIPSERQDLS